MSDLINVVDISEESDIAKMKLSQPKKSHSSLTKEAWNYCYIARAREVEGTLIKREYGKIQW